MNLILHLLLIHLFICQSIKPSNLSIYISIYYLTFFSIWDPDTLPILSSKLPSMEGTFYTVPHYSAPYTQVGP